MIKGRRIADALVLWLFKGWLHDQLLVFPHLGDEFPNALRFHRMRWKAELLYRAFDQFPFGQEAVPLLGSGGEDMHDPGLIAEVRIGGNPKMTRNSVSSNEANAIDVSSKLIRILRDHLDGLLCCPGAFDHFNALMGNARHFKEAFALLFNDIERFQTKVRHNAFRCYR